MSLKKLIKEKFEQKLAEKKPEEVTIVDAKKMMKGDDGYSPQKGKDYFTDDEINEFLQKITPVKGVHYSDGIKGDKGDSIKGDKGDGVKGDKGDKGDGVDKKSIKDFLSEQVKILKEDLLTLMNSQIDIKLTNREEKLIKIVKEMIAKVAQQLQKENRIGGGGIPAGKTKPHNLTSQADGSTKTFTTPTNFVSGTVRLRGSDFPSEYINGVDFNESGNNQLILTDEVDAPLTGQTLQAIYEEQ